MGQDQLREQCRVDGASIPPKRHEQGPIPPPRQDQGGRREILPDDMGNGAIGKSRRHQADARILSPDVATIEARRRSRTLPPFAHLVPGRNGPKSQDRAKPEIWQTYRTSSRRPRFLKPLKPSTTPTSKGIWRDQVGLRGLGSLQGVQDTTQGMHHWPAAA